MGTQQLKQTCGGCIWFKPRATVRVGDCLWGVDNPSPEWAARPTFRLATGGGSCKLFEDRGAKVTPEQKPRNGAVMAFMK